MTIIDRRNAHRPCAAAAAVLAALAGCAQTRTIELGEARFAPRPADHPIPIYDAEADLPHPFAKVARLQAWGGLRDDTTVEALRAEARRVGADAIVLTAARRPAEGCDDPDGVGGLAVRWVDADR